MAHGKRRDEWNRTSEILSLLYNAPMSGRAYRDPESFLPPEFQTGQIQDTAIQLAPADVQALFGGQLGKVT